MLQRRQALAKKRPPSRRRSRLSRPAPSAPRPPEKPIAGPEAFTNLVEPSHVQSQAATLLLLGFKWRGEGPAMEARAHGVSVFMPSATAGAVQAVPADDLAALG